MCQSLSSPTKEANCGTSRIFFKLPSSDAVEISTEGYATRARIVFDTIDELKKKKKGSSSTAPTARSISRQFDLSRREQCRRA